MAKIVKVQWKDTFTSVGWTDEPLHLSVIESVGWLVYKDKERIVLSGMLGSQKEWNNQQAIPRGCIVSIKELEG